VCGSYGNTPAEIPQQKYPSVLFEIGVANTMGSSRNPSPEIHGKFARITRATNFMKTVFAARSLYTPLEEIQNPLVFVEDGVITDLASRSAREIPANTALIDFADAVITPGFVDIHMHGGAGLDVMQASEGEVPRLGRFLAQHGVTGYFPTTVAAPLDVTCAALERIANAIEAAASSTNGDGNNDAPQARPLGIHLEGPFLSHARRGVHAPENLALPTVALFERLWQAARGHVRMLTIAPELPGAMEVIAEAARRKVLVSIGHSDADLNAAKAGVRAGARHATHTFNAMRPLDHREPGILAEVLTDTQLSADIIVDGIHVTPSVVQIFLKAKGIEGSVLITDATAAAGMPEGRYQLGTMMVDVKNGMCTIDGKLAGSVLTMDRAVRNVMKFGSWSLRDAVRAATLNPARAAGLTEQGQLGPGAEASFTVLSPSGEVRKTIVRGHGF
jgi:N-acetylglucosamine-6-phosphate deacetylase